MGDPETNGWMNLLLEKLNLDDTDVHSHRLRRLGTVFFYLKKNLFSVIKVDVENLPRGGGGAGLYLSSLSGSVLGVVSQSRGPIHFPISSPGVFSIQ